MSLELGHVLVALAGIGPVVLQFVDRWRRARRESRDVEQDARAQGPLARGPAVLRGRVAGIALVSVRELRWGTPAAHEVATEVDAELLTRLGPVRLEGPLVVRSGGASRERNSTRTDGARVLWRQSLRIAPGRDFVCAGDLVSSATGAWVLRGTDRAPLRAYAISASGTREPMLPLRAVVAGVALSACLYLALLGIGRGAENVLGSSRSSKSSLWRAACAVGIGCDPPTTPRW